VSCLLPTRFLIEPVLTGYAILHHNSASCRQRPDVKLLVQPGAERRFNEGFT